MSNNKSIIGSTISGCFSIIFLIVVGCFVYSCVFGGSDETKEKYSDLPAGITSQDVDTVLQTVQDVRSSQSTPTEIKLINDSVTAEVDKNGGVYHTFGSIRIGDNRTEYEANWSKDKQGKIKVFKITIKGDLNFIDHGDGLKAEGKNKKK